jgi:transcriptional regulator with PAS, ATPase and Fis domain
MARIAFIAPDKRLLKHGEKIVRKLGISDRVDFYLAVLQSAIDLAKRLEREDVDVIVSRGGTAKVMIESKVNIPVVEIVIGGQDLAQMFHNVKKITGRAKPKVAMLAFSNMVHDIDVLSSILEVDLTIFPLQRIEDIPQKVDEVSVTDADMVVGGIHTITLAKKKGLPSYLIRSGDYAVEAAFIEAQKVALGRKIEKERAQEFKALVDYSLDGIISINSGRTIRVFNQTAERLLQYSARDVIGKDMTDVFPFFNVDPCLEEGRELIGQVLSLTNISITANIAPIMVGRDTVGAIISFQDIGRIQEVESKIRNEVLARRLTAKYQFADIIGISAEISETLRIARQIAGLDATILISGESGTGKELFAQSIHNSSRRHNGPFVAINCAALPANLLESELFGYVEGAFTGAIRKGKPGMFELAHRGTIFLDEISEMDRYGQARLLRIIQEKQVMRLGDDKYIPIDVRIISATNKNLGELVRQGEFRQDLYYRLKVLTINIPPLRKRTGDIEHLARLFLRDNCARHRKQLDLSSHAYNFLSEYPWPGNVRELMHFLERLVLSSTERNISVNTVKKYLEDREYDSASDFLPMETTAHSEERRIKDALGKTNSNIKKAADLLGINRSTLYRRLSSFNIEIKKKY